jgi:hypothetical protein
MSADVGVQRRNPFPISPFIQSATLFVLYLSRLSALLYMSGLLRFRNLFVCAPDYVFYFSTAVPCE